MEVLKTGAATLLAVSIPLLMGNKGCREEGKSYEHPAVARTANCQECHEEGYGVEVKPAWHDIAWRRDHGPLVRKQGFRTDQNCTVCHAQSSCTECHAVEKPRGHTQFFRLRGHGLEVGLDRTRCTTCHKADECQRCHMETRPLSHRGGWGGPANRHCLECHFPVSSVGAQACAVCHTATPSHAAGTPAMPSNAKHLPGADCRSAGCHVPLRHPDNGMECTICHTR